jgi:hypothetical protein
MPDAVADRARVRRIARRLRCAVTARGFSPACRFASPNDARTVIVTPGRIALFAARCCGGGPTGARMTASSDRDLECFRLRVDGSSFGAIADDLGYANAPQATAAFHRVLREQDAGVRTRIRDEEHDRLDALAEQVRGDAALDESTRERRATVIERMRRDLDAAAGTPGS